MEGEDWACCYILVEKRSAAEVAELIKGRLGRQWRTEEEAARQSVAWPSIGPTGLGWALLIDPHFEFGDADVEMRVWSVGTRLVRLSYIGREHFGNVKVWTDGNSSWEVSFEGETDKEPTIEGLFPYGLSALAPPGASPEEYARVPAAAVRLLTGWEPRRVGEASFVTLEYDRTETVADWVLNRSAGTQ
ncbi:hypothetical protein [Actinoplanes sp. NPDC051851]|uniref:hypothetical protein n=1 Tax=Actinoplanes sp. NPDC051851 TaxID=3154753 RepID=UPI0034449E7B